MSVPVKLVAFAVGIAAAFGIGLGAGAIADPLDQDGAPAGTDHEEVHP